LFLSKIHTGKQALIIYDSLLSNAALLPINMLNNQYMGPPHLTATKYHRRKGRSEHGEAVGWRRQTRQQSAILSLRGFGKTVQHGKRPAATGRPRHLVTSRPPRSTFCAQIKRGSQSLLHTARNSQTVHVRLYDDPERQCCTDSITVGWTPPRPRPALGGGGGGGGGGPASQGIRLS